MTTTETHIASVIAESITSVMDESIATIMKIKTPQFVNSGPDANFIKIVKDEFIDYYIKDGKYFRNHVTLHKPYTTVYLKLDKIFNILAPINMNKNDRYNKISEISIKLISQIPYIMSELDIVLPSLLKTMNWEYCKLEYSNYDMSQFSGMDETGPTPVPTFGASACMIVMYMKPIDGTIPMHKPSVNQTKEETKTEEPKIIMSTKNDYVNAARRGVIKTDELVESDKNTNINITDVKPKVVSKGKRPTK